MVYFEHSLSPPRLVPGSPSPPPVFPLTCHAPVTTIVLTFYSGILYPQPQQQSERPSFYLLMEQVI